MGDIVISALLIINYIPATIYFVYYRMEFFPLVTLFFVCLVAANEWMPYFTLRIKTRYRIDRERLCEVLLCVCVAIPFYIWWRYADFRIFFSLKGVYQVRGLASEYDLPTILLYAYRMSTLLLGTFGVYYLSMKKRVCFLIACLGLFLSYCIDAMKGTIALILGECVLYWVSQYIGSMVDKIAAGCSAVIVAAWAERALLHSRTLENILIQRLLFMPNEISFLYYDFAQKFGFDFYRSGVLRRFGFPYTYGKPIPQVIGGTYIGFFYKDTEVCANNGLFSDAYLNLGLAGMFILPILMVVVLRVFDMSVKGLDPRLYLPLCVGVTAQLISNALFTTLLSGGIMAMILILLLLPREGERYNSGKTGEPGGGLRRAPKNGLSGCKMGKTFRKELI